MPLFSRDTREAAERYQIEIYRSLSPVERFKIGVEMSDNIRDIAIAGLRRRFPELSETEIRNRYLFEVWGVLITGGDDSEPTT